MHSIRAAQFGRASGDAELCRMLMREYAAYLNHAVGGQHICVESLEKELAELPGEYAEPAGTVLLAFVDEEPAGCVALKPLKRSDPGSSERACEMKRLWVRPGQQGACLGGHLAEAVVGTARERGYMAMYLDTMPASMRAAYGLYQAMGFAPVERHNNNPVLRQADVLEIAWLRREL